MIRSGPANKPDGPRYYIWGSPNTSQNPMVLGQTTQTRVPPHALTASNLFFQGNENEIHKDVCSRSVKEDDNHSVASGSTYEDQKYWLQSTEIVVKVGPMAYGA